MKPLSLLYLTIPSQSMDLNTACYCIINPTLSIVVIISTTGLILALTLPNLLRNRNFYTKYFVALALSDIFFHFSFLPYRCVLRFGHSISS
jgi:hypothetical protein